MSKVLLIVPPLPERSYPGKFMGLDYLATALIKKNHKVKILDLDIFFSRGQNVIEILQNEILKYEPQLVGITNLSIQNDIANYLAWLTKKIRPSIIVVKGGFHEITGWQYTLELHHEYVDAVVVGDGEVVIQEIAEAIDKKNWDNKKQEIPSLAWWNGNKAVLNQGYRYEINFNDYIPTRMNYFPEHNFEVFNFQKTAQVMTYRGCPYYCAFCSEAFFPSKVSQRTIENVIEELDLLRNDNYRAIYFDDSTFTLNKDRALTIVNEVYKRNFIWGCNTRVDLLPDDLIYEFGSKNCRYLFCGVESFVPEVLLAMNKTRTPDKYLREIPRVYCSLRKANISPSIFLIFGNARKEIDNTIIPEKWDDVEYCLRQAISLDVDYISLNILRFLPEVSFSIRKEFSSIRPNNGEIIHAGHYDLKWYFLNGKKDMRSLHPIFRCFEGARSVNPDFVTPEYAYNIIKLAIELVNKHNSDNAIQTRIVVDQKAFDFFYEKKVGGKIQYEILPFNRMNKEIELNPLIENWKKIITQTNKKLI